MMKQKTLLIALALMGAVTASAQKHDGGLSNDMLAAIRKQYDDTTEKMAKLKVEGKEKTVTYRQLFANKLQIQAMLSYYRT